MSEPPEEAVAVLRDALKDDGSLVREHAAWALERASATSGDDWSGAWERDPTG